MTSGQQRHDGAEQPDRWYLAGLQQLQQEKAAEHANLIAWARLSVMLLRVSREKGEFFALHPQQFTDSLYTLESLMGQIAATCPAAGS